MAAAQASEGFGSPRVLVLGLGAVTPQGIGADSLWEGTREGRVAVRPAPRWSIEGYPTRLAGEVRDLERPLGVPESRGFRDRAFEFAAAATDEAVHAHQDLFARVPPERRAAVVGTCNGGLLSGLRWFDGAHRAPTHREGHRAPHGETHGEPTRREGQREPHHTPTHLEPDPWLVTHLPPQALAEFVAARHGLRGPVHSINTACAAGANAIGFAADLLRSGHADLALAGGSDALSETLVAGFSSLESLSHHPAQPYPAERVRFSDEECTRLSLGEGSGMLLLVREELLGGGGDPLAEVLGYGLSADGYHATTPEPEGQGLCRAIRSALANAGVRADEVGYVNGHGSYVQGGASDDARIDLAEALGINSALGEANDKLVVGSTNPMIGHLLGAAGAAEAIVTTAALCEQVAPPTAGPPSDHPATPPSHPAPLPSHPATPPSDPAPLPSNPAPPPSNPAAPSGHPATPPSDAAPPPSNPAPPIDVVGAQARPHPMEVAISNNSALGGANASLVLARARSRAAPLPLPRHDRVVVTGLALLTPAGSTPEDAWRAITQSTDCTTVDPGLGVRLGRCALDTGAQFDRRELRGLDRISVLALLASKLALADAGEALLQGREERVGVMLGTGIGPMESIERFAAPVAASGPLAANPAVLPSTVFSQAAGRVAQRLRALGPTSTVTTGHAAGAAALAYARDLVSTGRADAMLVTAADALTDTVVHAYRGLGLLGDATGRSPGMALSEGGVALVVENLRSAQARRARVYAEVLGHATASDARGVGQVDPRGGGMERAMRRATANSGLSLADIGEVWANANGSRLVDVPERRALRRVFAGPQPHVWRPRTLLGEPCGVGGALGAALAALSQDHGAADGHSLLNSTSLGGTHVSVVLGPAPDDHAQLGTAIAA